MFLSFFGVVSFSFYQYIFWLPIKTFQWSLKAFLLACSKVFPGERIKEMNGKEKGVLVPNLLMTVVATRGVEFGELVSFDLCNLDRIGTKMWR